MLPFKRLNLLAGWFTFVVAFATYALTVERTASFWDCGEFIASSFKLQIPHPPGAPLFLLTGRIFSMLSLGDLTRVAYWINMASVLASAFTILFLFWTISLLAQKLLPKPENDYTPADTWLILGTSAVGALAYTFSDTFWFSAVEAEVYGMSSFFTAIVVWASFKWERINDAAAANRWLIFIAYLIGLSIGVHLLNLVILPALALIYYFHKSPKPTFWGGIMALGIGLFLLGIINASIPGLPALAFAVERFFVNTLGFPFNMGTIVFSLALLSALGYGIHWSIRRQRVVWNTSLLAVAFLLIGYASYMQVMVRAGFNPPINENDPSDINRFRAYQAREQYESRSLLYGPVFTSRPIDQKRGAPIWKRDKDRYVVVDYYPEYIYAPGDKMLFPRVYSTHLNHPQLYRQILGLAEGQKPTMGDNLKFLFTYQLNHMWWRYLMWNFAGRESDEEGAGFLTPWTSNQNVPDLLKANKARDNFYMLPFALALLGLLFQYKRRRNDFVVVSLLFLLTGLALQIFLNSPPSEPRERDYIYVGSFYFFAIWLGLGAMAIVDALRSFLPRFKSATFRQEFVIGMCLLVPVMMCVKSWDNHNRNHRFHSVDFAKNMLNSCAQNAILFTEGDNDTFPLWYVQEVEGFRRDVRVCNLSLLGTEWYIQQMKRKTYESDALPMSLAFDQFNKGKNDIIPFYEVDGVKSGIDLKQYIGLVKTNNPAIQVPLTTGEMTNILPSSVLFLPVDKKAVEQAGFVPAPLRPFVNDTMQWTIGKKDLFKPDLIMLDMIATNNWKRPIYFSSTLASEHYLNLKNYMQLEGYAYRLMPVAIPGATDGYVNSDIMYDTLMHKTHWREFDNPDVYYDETYKGPPVISGRLAFLRLADQLIRESKPEKAREVLNYSLAVMPDKSLPYDQISSNYVQLLFAVNDVKKALTIADTMVTRADQNLTYARTGQGQFSNTNTDLYVLQTIVEACEQANQPVAAARYEAIFQKHLNALG
ncbi:protein O-mannosyl-transferase family [Spirosoma sp.]|uniref:glycosyltransferase family 117 protein n=1 Tax=Spirosoma sp. TaxID=1899569 RepID=UPI003B3B1C81